MIILLFLLRENDLCGFSWRGNGRLVLADPLTPKKNQNICFLDHGLRHVNAITENSSRRRITAIRRIIAGPQKYKAYIFLGIFVYKRKIKALKGLSSTFI